MIHLVLNSAYSFWCITEVNSHLYNNIVGRGSNSLSEGPEKTKANKVICRAYSTHITLIYGLRSDLALAA